MNRKGFTLIELMIVVAIIGILAAIAIPSFLAMQLRAKRSELPTNLDAIRTAEKAYHAEWDAFTDCILTPATVSRDPQVFTGSGLTAFQNLGWTADGNVRGQYAVTLSATGSGPADDSFQGHAYSNIDGAGGLSHYYCTQAQKPKMLSQNNVY
jgi:type IV pilus assembly protein PilA